MSDGYRSLLPVYVDGLSRLAAAERLEEVQPFDAEELTAKLRSGKRYMCPGDARSFFASGTRDAPMTTASTSGALLAASQPQLHDFRRRLFVRDLIPSQPMTTYAEMFVRELHPVADEAGATGVPEFGLKPDDSAGVEFEPTNVVPGTVAVSLPEISKQLMDDSAAFVAWLQRRLPYKLAVREEWAFLFGDGSVGAGGITGIASTSGVSTGSSADLVTAITDAESACADVVDAVVCNKNDWSALRKSDPDFCRALQEDLLVVRATSVTAGTVFAGSWANGALILDREDAAVEIFDSHGDNPIRNKMAVRCEERVGFWVAEPQSFAVRTF